MNEMNLAVRISRIKESVRWLMNEMNLAVRISRIID